MEKVSAQLWNIEFYFGRVFIAKVVQLRNNMVNIFSSIESHYRTEDSISDGLLATDFSLSGCVLRNELLNFLPPTLPILFVQD